MLRSPVMDDDFEIIESPLCQDVEHGGKTISVKIYGNGNGKWILEVEDEFWNSTVWENAFDTDSEALEEVHRVIREEGISNFIGVQNSHHP